MKECVSVKENTGRVKGVSSYIPAPSAGGGVLWDGSLTMRDQGRTMRELEPFGRGG